MKTTFGDMVPSAERSSMKRRESAIADALAENARLERELEQERGRVRRLEDQLREARRLENLGRIASGVAHDFSNIMAVISGYSELMLKRMDPTDPLRSGAESIRKATAWGLNLTQHVLASSRPPVVAGPPAPRDVDVNSVAANVVRTLQPLLGEHIAVTMAFEPALGRVDVNAAELEQVVMNLLLNARDALEAGGRLTVETANVDLDQREGRPPLATVMLRVTDTGHGMDTATLSRALEPYFTTKPPGKGTGLGLSTVFAFVTQNGGHIDVASEVSEGATFSVFLPRVDAPPAPFVVPSTGRPTVLVVEGETGVRELIGEILDLHGYDVLQARDLEQAIALDGRHAGPIALVIADVMVPGVPGDYLIKRLGPSRRNVRVLYISGDLEDTVEEYRGLRTGRAFLRKPFTVDALVRAVREVLEA